MRKKPVLSRQPRTKNFIKTDRQFCRSVLSYTSADTHILDKKNWKRKTPIVKYSLNSNLLLDITKHYDYNTKHCNIMLGRFDDRELFVELPIDDWKNNAL